MQLHALEPLYTIFYTLVCKNVSSCWLKFSGKIVNKYMENLRQTSGEIWAQLQPQKFASRILCCVALSYNSYFFQNSRFTKYQSMQIFLSFYWPRAHVRSLLPENVFSLPEDFLKNKLRDRLIEL